MNNIPYGPTNTYDTFNFAMIANTAAYKRYATQIYVSNTAAHATSNTLVYFNNGSANVSISLASYVVQSFCLFWNGTAWTAISSVIPYYT